MSLAKDTSHLINDAAANAQGIGKVVMDGLQHVGNLAVEGFVTGTVGLLAIAAGVVGMDSAAEVLASSARSTTMNSDHRSNSSPIVAQSNSHESPAKERVHSVGIDQDGNEIGALKPTPVAVAAIRNVGQGQSV